MEGPTSFGRKLAHTEKKIRDRAVKTLSAWLSTQDKLTELEMLKLWKGLFFSFWMSDKPTIQQEMARSLSSITHILPKQIKLLYLSCFWKTILREWTRIDRLRLDKYYYLLRQFHISGVKYLQSENWAEEIMEKYCQILSDGPLRPNCNKIPAGVQYHTCEVALDQVTAALEGKNMPSKAFIQYIHPFINLLAQTSSNVVINKLKDEFMEKLLTKVKNQIRDGRDNYDEDEATKIELNAKEFADFFQIQIQLGLGTIKNKKVFNHYYVKLTELM